MRLTQEIEPNVEFEGIDCDFCSSKKYEVWAQSRSNRLTRCSDCGLIRTNPRIKDKDYKYKKLYDSAYFLQKNRFTKEEKDARIKTYQKEYSSLFEIVKGGKILDVGCGMGTFLSEMKGDWNKFGCDVSEFGLQTAAQFGIKTYLGEFEELNFDIQKFDVIYMRASLHHTYSPSKCIKRAHELLNANGILALTMCSNSDGVMGKLFRGHVKSYDQTVNYLFNSKTLRWFLEKTGFEIICCEYPYFGTGYNSIRDILQFPILYSKYIYARFKKIENSINFRDITSPAFYGNYLNIYARKK